MNGAQGTFREVTLLGVTLTVGTCRHTFVRPHRLDDTKSELSCELWTLGVDDTSVSVY